MRSVYIRLSGTAVRKVGEYFSLANVLMMICLHDYARVRMTIDCRLASEALKSRADSAEIRGRKVRLLAQSKKLWKENAMKPNKAENEQGRNPRRLCTTDLWRRQDLTSKGNEAEG
jgi:hypothetical protein